MFLTTECLSHSLEWETHRCVNVFLSKCLYELAGVSVLCLGTSGALSAGGWLLLWRCID